MSRVLRGWLMAVAVFGAMWALVGCGQSVGQEPGGPTPVVGAPQWAMYGATPLRNGRSEVEGPRFGEQRVVTLTDEGVEAQVLVEAVGPEGTVYAIVREAGGIGRLVSLESADEERWSFPAGEAMAVGGAALTEDGALFLGGMQRVDGGDPERVRADVFWQLGVDGLVHWSWHPPESVGIVAVPSYSAPLYDVDGTSYAVHPALYDSALTVFDRRLNAYGPDGALRWQWERDVCLSGIPPALGLDGNLRVLRSRAYPEVEPEEGLYVLSNQGQELAFTPLPLTFVVSFALGDDGTAYLAGQDEVGATVVAVGSDGNERWRWHSTTWLGSGVTTSVAVAAEDTVTVGLATDDGGALVALTPQGEQRWATETVDFPCGGMAVDRTGAVYALTNDPNHSTTLVGLEPDGEVRLQVELGGEPLRCFNAGTVSLSMSVVLAEGRAYVGSEDGTLHIVQ